MSPRDRDGDRDRDEPPVLPQRSADDADLGWGGGGGSTDERDERDERDDDWYQRERPPHW